MVKNNKLAPYIIACVFDVSDVLALNINAIAKRVDDLVETSLIELLWVVWNLIGYRMENVKMLNAGFVCVTFYACLPSMF
jgi:hypothetical protein